MIGNRLDVIDGDTKFVCTLESDDSYTIDLHDNQDRGFVVTGLNLESILAFRRALNEIIDRTILNDIKARNRNGF